jgi:DNA polymerase-3 subunit beta
VSLERATLAQSLNRAAILSNEKIRGVRLVFTKDALSIICTNNEQEEAEEGLALEYDGTRSTLASTSRTSSTC